MIYYKQENEKKNELVTICHLHPDCHLHVRLRHLHPLLLVPEALGGQISCSRDKGHSGGKDQDLSDLCSSPEDLRHP